MFILLFSQWFCAHQYLHSFPTRRSSDLSQHHRHVRAEDSAVDVALVNHQVAQGFQQPRPPLRIAENRGVRSEEHTSELQSRFELVCRLLLEKKNPKCDKLFDE